MILSLPGSLSLSENCGADLVESSDEILLAKFLRDYKESGMSLR